MDGPRLIIVGAGGHGAELLSYLQGLLPDRRVSEFLGFLDDDPARASSAKHVIGGLTSLTSWSGEFFQNVRYLTAIGDNPRRQRVVDTLERLYGEHLLPWTLIHPMSYVGQGVEIGCGTCLAPNAIVTCRTRIGRHSILNVKVSVSHDCVIGDFVNLNPAATVCGNVTIGSGAYIGAGATVKDKIKIGAGAIIGAGAVVVDDMPPGVTAVGVPARIIKQPAVVG
jgi:acetyltransferase EpsM